MKKKFICSISLMFSIITFATIFNVYAEKEERESKAKIQFMTNTGPTYPVDPEEPEDLIPGGPAIDGQLAIVYVNDFNFGTGVLSYKKQFYNIATKRPNIQIVDLRPTGSGWKLEASVSALKGNESGMTLKGATIHIKNGRLNSELPMKYAPNVYTNIELTTDGNLATIMRADQNKGQGLWINRLYPDEDDEDPDIGQYVTLEIPADVTVADTYYATMMWILSNTP